MRLVTKSESETTVRHCLMVRSALRHRTPDASYRVPKHDQHLRSSTAEHRASSENSGTISELQMVACTKASAGRLQRAACRPLTAPPSRSDSQTVGRGGAGLPARALPSLSAGLSGRLNAAVEQASDVRWRVCALQIASLADRAGRRMVMPVAARAGQEAGGDRPAAAPGIGRRDSALASVAGQR